MDAADWKAPANDCQVLVLPGQDQLLAAARANHQRLSQSAILISDKPLPLWRQQMRQTLGHASPEQLLFCSGHQAELYHPGVWIKLAIIDRLAQATNGRALQIAVDSDAPKHLQLRWPGGGIELSPRTDPAVAWAGQLPIPAAAHLQSILTEAQRASQQWDFPSLLPDFLKFLIDASQKPNAKNLSTAIARAMQKLDHQNLGLSYALCMSESIWSSEPYLAFVAHLLTNAQAFAHSYNHALAKYRAQERITSPGRPMPDLAHDADRIELPFWLDDLTTGLRERLSVAQTPAGPRLDFHQATLPLSPSTVADLAQFCAANNIRIAPRALTLTMFLRLFAADYWIHGIGGARYDQVTDQIIRDFFHLDPPAFGVATATLYFPTASDRQRISLSAVKHTGHQLKHRVLDAAKAAYVDQITTAPRRSPARAHIFTQMHRAMAEHASPALLEWNTQWQHAQIAAEQDRTIFDRELFYALQPANRLQSLLRAWAF